jgi:hypothetical protein
MIQNPKKEIHLEFPIDLVKNSIKRIAETKSNNYKLENVNDILNQITLSSFEFLSVGVFIDFNFIKKSESSTLVTIEVRRKIGSFDESFEVSNANEHINKLTNIMSQMLIMNDSEFNQYSSSIKSQKDKTTALLLCLFLGNFGGHSFYAGKTSIGVLQLLTLGGCGIWSLIDLIMIIVDKYKDSNGLTLNK